MSINILVKKEDKDEKTVVNVDCDIPYDLIDKPYYVDPIHYKIDHYTTFNSD